VHKFGISVISQDGYYYRLAMSTKYWRKYRRMTRGTPHAKARAAGGGSKSTAVETSMSEIRERISGKEEAAASTHRGKTRALVERLRI